MKARNRSGVVLLDNPMWSALTTDQAQLAQGGNLAKRFPRDVASFAAIPHQSAAAYQALGEILKGDVAAFFLDSRPVPPPSWSVVASGEVYQMVCEAPLPAQPSLSLRKLSEADIPEMLALTKLTEPGPFLPRTIEMGDYFGIHESGSLVAMAGERLKLTGYTEVSAVCTRPDYRGRGYGSTLMSVVMEGITNRGETPFLHVRTDNPAQSLYQKLGFQVRALLHLAVIRSGPSQPSYNQK
jgi:ribosomal protein S18 acetylase RimI-like enzyme